MRSTWLWLKSILSFYGTARVLHALCTRRPSPVSFILFFDFIIIGMIITICACSVFHTCVMRMVYYQQICQSKCLISWQINFKLSMDRTTESYDIICDAYQISVSFGECKCIWLVRPSTDTSISASPGIRSRYICERVSDMNYGAVACVCAQRSDMWKRAYLWIFFFSVVCLCSVRCALIG